MVISMAAFAIEDSLIKALSQYISTGQILILFGIGGASTFTVIARIQRAPLFSWDVVSSPMRVRFIFELSGRLFYFLALAFTPLIATTAILQATPIIVVAGAAIFMNEKVNAKKWMAIVLGLVGVLIILQPTSSDFSPVSLLAVLGMLGFSGRDLASRAAPLNLSTPTLGFYGFLTVTIAGLLYTGWTQSPLIILPGPALILIFSVIFIGVLAYSTLMKAMRTGAVSVIAPFRYTRMIFGIAIGVFIFGEVLTMEMVIGSLVIISSGLFIVIANDKVK
jgi:drug/metabolite transporter (DMT)-like permease